MLAPDSFHHDPIRRVNFDPELAAIGVRSGHVVEEGQASMLVDGAGDTRADDQPTIVGGGGGIIQVEVISSCKILKHMNLMKFTSLRRQGFLQNFNKFLRMADHASTT